MKKPEYIVLFLMAFAVSGLLLSQRRTTRYVPVQTTQVNPSPNHGIEIQPTRLEVVDLNAFRNFAANAIERAVQNGARGASGVLVEMMRQAFPRYPWPPKADSVLWPQWCAMVKDVAEALHMEPEPEPIGRPKLRVVE
jgi:hypothetical protein